MKPFVLALALCALGIGMNTARAVDVGDKAPSFSATDDQGKEWKSADHIGKGVLVVYFYPADLTGGCTKQACGYRDDMQALKDKGVEVVGVSGDSVENHQMFKKEKNLNFTLLSDESGTIAKAFGVPTDPGRVVKRINGKKLQIGVLAKRWTFVIDKGGKVIHKETKVKAPGEDSKAVLHVVETAK